jgi:hypothetical protein
MIISVNPRPTLDEFVILMQKTDAFLNEDALIRPSYYVTRVGTSLEDDVKSALEECAKGTPFENTIEKISGQKFPDIVASKYYGVEVKSTKENHWTSTGSSILETTRVEDVQRIFLTFGKLGGNPIQFLSKPYEKCLSGIAVTHMPRYLIDMRLNEGETIFDKIGIEYDQLRNMDNPIAPVSRYYRSQLKAGESLWWTGDNTDCSVPATMRLWRTLSPEEKRKCVAYGCAIFPEVFKSNYDRYSLWLASQGIVNNNVRDGFSAGGQENMKTSAGIIIKMPAIFGKVKENCDYIIDIINSTDESVLNENWGVVIKTKDEKISTWCKCVAELSNIEYDLAKDILTQIVTSSQI